MQATLEVFASLPLAERLFVRGRLASAPLTELAARARGAALLDAAIAALPQRLR